MKIAPPSLAPHHSSPATRDFQDSVCLRINTKNPDATGDPHLLQAPPNIEAANGASKRPDPSTAETWSGVSSALCIMPRGVDWSDWPRFGTPP